MLHNLRGSDAFTADGDGPFAERVKGNLKRCLKDFKSVGLGAVQKYAPSLDIKNALFTRFQSLLKVSHCEEGTNQEQSPPAYSPFDVLTFENLNREYKSVITQDNYDGFRLEADRQITKNFQASHSLYLGTLLRDIGYIYQIGTNYASDDGSCIAMAKIGLDGMVTARAILKCGYGIEIRANGNSFLSYDHRNAYEMGIDYVADNWTGTLKGAWQGTWIMNAAYTHQILPYLTLGSELTYIVANGASVASLGARYVNGDNILTLQWSLQPNFKAMDFEMRDIQCGRVQYTRRVNERLSLATELELAPEIKDSALRLGWDYTFRHARVQGSIDSSGKIAMQAQDFSGFGVSGCIDYWNNIYRFGFMMHLLPPQEPKPEEQTSG